MPQTITLPSRQNRIGRDLDRADAAIDHFEHEWLKQGLLALPLLERIIVVWHFGIGCDPSPTADIGDRLGIPTRRVDLIKEQALARLRALGTELAAA